MSLLRDRLFELLEDAIKAARSLDPAVYAPNSARWHEFDKELGLCEVCLSGAVIAGLDGVDVKASVSPGSFVKKNRVGHKLVAIDHMRNGMWALAYYAAYGEVPNVEVFGKLALIPKPRPSDFCDWTTFNQLLDSLDLIIPQLREIEVDPPYIMDDGTMDTVVYCPKCDKEIRGSFDSTLVEGDLGRPPTEKESEDAYAEFTRNMVNEHIEECGTEGASGTTTIGNLFQAYMRAKEIDEAATDLVLEFLGVEDVRKFVLNQYRAAYFGLEHVRLLTGDYDNRRDYFYEVLFQACTGLPQFRNLKEFDQAPEQSVEKFLEQKFSA